MTYPIRTLHQLRPILLGLRKKAGLSQANLAAQLGITQQSYAKIEANPTATSFERLYKIVRLLGGELYLTTQGEDAGQPGKAPAPSAPQPGKPAPPTQTPSNKEVW
jgi:HTH-type transcriptional regulator/antitoxin HipB